MLYALGTIVPYRKVQILEQLFQYFYKTVILREIATFPMTGGLRGVVPNLIKDDLRAKWDLVN